MGERIFPNCTLCGTASQTSKKKAGRRRVKGWKDFSSGVAVCPKCSDKFVKRGLGFTLYLLEDDKDKRAADFQHIRESMKANRRAYNFFHSSIQRIDPPPVQASKVTITKAESGKASFSYDHWVKFSEAVTDSETSRIYHEARAKFPILNSSTLAQIKQDVISKYKRERYKCRYTCDQNWPNYGLNRSMPIYVTDYSFSWLNAVDDIVVAAIRFGDRHLRFRIRRTRRTSSAVKELVRHLREVDAWKTANLQPKDALWDGGSSRVCEEAAAAKPPSMPGTSTLAFKFEAANPHDNRPVVKVKDDKGKKGAYRFAIKVAVWRPKMAAGYNQDRVLIVQPSPTGLIRYGCGEGRFFRVSGDKLKQRIAEYWKGVRRGQSGALPAKKLLCRVRRQRERMQAFSDDRKAVLRSSIKALEHPRQTASKTYANLMDTEVFKLAALLAGRAARYGANTVIWVAGPSPFDALHFPWSELKTKLKHALEARGICFRDATSEEAGDLLAENEDEDLPESRS